MKRIASIEGLRAWLALWVLADHVMSFSGYDDDNSLTGVPKLVREGILAVELFMIISGFVIFALLDQRRESYGQFIGRRFFRIYPLYLLLFLLAIPASLLRHWAALHGHAWLSPAEFNGENQLFANEWREWRVGIPTHLVLLHGLVPDAWHGWSSTCLMWLGPAWSISLEWQFYLLAPAVFLLAISRKAIPRLVLVLLCAALFYLGHRYVWSMAFLPFHAEFFFIGAASYFLYKRYAWRGGTTDGPGLFLAAGCFGWMLYLLSGKVREVIPLALWIMFLALLLESENRVATRWLRSLFTHPVPQFLGKISYSIYLSHELVIGAAQSALVYFLPNLGQRAHFWVLLGVTVPVTIGISALLYRFIERPAIEWGRRLTARPVIETSVANYPIIPASPG